MAKISAQTPAGDRIEVMDTNANAVVAAAKGKSDNPELTNWQIDGKPVDFLEKNQSRSSLTADS